MSERTASRPGGQRGDGGSRAGSAGSSAGSTGSSTETSTGTRPLGQRISDRFSNAADEHRANADAEAKPVGRRASGQPSVGGGKGPRRARLRLTRVDPWSVMKTAFLLAVAFGVVTFVAVFMIWSVLGAAGVWESINATVASVIEGENSASDLDITNYVGMSRVLGFTLLVSVIDVVLLTAIATLGAFLYNMAAALLGGIEMTLAEDER